MYSTNFLNKIQKTWLCNVLLKIPISNYSYYSLYMNYSKNDI